MGRLGRDQQDRGCKRKGLPPKSGLGALLWQRIILPRLVFNLSRATMNGSNLQTSWMNCFNRCTLRCRFTQLQSLKDAIKLQIGLHKTTKARDNNNRYHDLKQTKKYWLSSHHTVNHLDLARLVLAFLCVCSLAHWGKNMTVSDSIR